MKKMYGVLFTWPRIMADYWQKQDYIVGEDFAAFQKQHIKAKKPMFPIKTIIEKVMLKHFRYATTLGYSSLKIFIEKGQDTTIISESFISFDTFNILEK